MMRQERGSETVQFAVALPLVLALVFSIMQVSGMTLGASQLSSEITRASRQLDAAGFLEASDKEAFVKASILGTSTQLKAEGLRIEDVSWKSERQDERRDGEAGALEQRSSLLSLRYALSYRLPVAVEVPGLSGATLERQVSCTFVGDRVIETLMVAP